MHFSEEVAREVLRCGARGYVLKSDADGELLSAVRHIQSDKPFFTGKLAATMAESFVRDTRGTGPSGVPDEAPLSQRELEVVQLLASGKSNKEAAASIGVSTRTVESHRNHITVSYTHLDVYKRQKLFHVQRRIVIQVRHS